MKERYKTAQAYMQKLRFLIEDVSEGGAVMEQMWIIEFPSSLSLNTVSRTYSCGW